MTGRSEKSSTSFSFIFQGMHLKFLCSSDHTCIIWCVFRIVFSCIQREKHFRNKRYKNIFMSFLWTFKWFCSLSEEFCLKNSSNELERYCLFFHTKSLTSDKFWKIQFVCKSWRRYFPKINQICSSTTIDIFCSYSNGFLIDLEFVAKSQ